MMRHATVLPSKVSAFVLAMVTGYSAFAAPINIPDTGQDRCYDNSRYISCADSGETFYGQDAQYQSARPAYRDNADGTVTDLVTGLMWSKAVSPDKLSLEQAQDEAESMTLGGHSDWRVPNIKELYSLIDFRGYTGFSGRRSFASVPSNAIPFINTDYFDFLYGPSNERYIDAQWLSSTRYVSTTMGGATTLFGVNFADGRIKGYGYRHPGRLRDAKRFYVRYVRGGSGYGNNQFVDNGDGTVTDEATGLTWAQMDSGKAMNWQQALAYAENLNLAGHSDWRLPNAKELQYIVDYSRSPDTSNSPAIDPVFKSTSMTNEAGEKDYPSYWTSTTHRDGPRPDNSAAYVSFGRALGQMHGRIMDVHGAGAQRSDPKTGRAQLGRGPQGDAVRVKNFVRVVRGGNVVARTAGTNKDSTSYPNNVAHLRTQPQSSAPDYQRGMGQQGGSMGVSNQGGMADQSAAAAFIQRLDTDGDGRVSRSEFDGPKNRFNFHDKNRDGYLSEDEAPQGPPSGMGRPPR